MKFILMSFTVLSLFCGGVFAGNKTDLSFYNDGQLVKTRTMTLGEIKSFEALETSTQVMAIIDKRNGQSDADTKKIIDKFVNSKGVGEKLKQALNMISMSLEFELSSKGFESTILEAYALRHHEASTKFKKGISVSSGFAYDEIRIAGKRVY